MFPLPFGAPTPRQKKRKVQSTSTLFVLSLPCLHAQLRTSSWMNSIGFMVPLQVRKWNICTLHNLFMYFKTCNKYGKKPLHLKAFSLYLKQLKVKNGVQAGPLWMSPTPSHSQNPHHPSYQVRPAISQSKLA